MIKFYMAGSGSWWKFFPDQKSYNLYQQIYQTNPSLDELSEEGREQVRLWQEVNFIKVENKAITPLIPVFTNEDNEILKPYFSSLIEKSTQIISNKIDDYRNFSAKLARASKLPSDYILTILLCAYTLDTGTLDSLKKGAIGKPPKRDDDNHYFLWGESAKRDLRSFFGVNSSEIRPGLNISMIWSPAIKQEISQQNISLPFFNSDILEEINCLCNPMARQLAIVFTGSIVDLDGFLDKSSFKNCSRGDILCMLFHIGYGLITENLIKQSLLPKFPEEVNDGWGMWMWT